MHGEQRSGRHRDAQTGPAAADPGPPQAGEDQRGDGEPQGHHAGRSHGGVETGRQRGSALQAEDSAEDEPRGGYGAQSPDEGWCGACAKGGAGADGYRAPCAAGLAP
ncbi:hypothetical protein GCM10010260_36720 [Streptomyces filipinensis]|uniref:Uncharacterized protein n=1 Tax=Streptomyces filipinensis TaxID=66887 RepID=A0A918IBZ0_9ACTN|nr:hypothetical protein GCM10010260_36720 [Streptomyces filipinensis]